MSDHRKPNVGLLILAGIGAGVLAGAIVGIAMAARRRGDDTDKIVDSVDDLRNRAERVLQELSTGLSDLKETTQRITADIAGSLDAAVESRNV